MKIADQIEEQLSYFKYDHLPPHLQNVSKGFHDLAHKLVKETAPGHALLQSLDHLLIAKDAGVRATLYKYVPNEPESNEVP